ncbi:PAS domain-containing protein [Cyclobacterium plantarum]|uniref:PAS domain-containing protein n=1 Tax=Cyclobacterium plantarum TaxID=2716263 RepID=UPI003F6F2FDA
MEKERNRLSDLLNYRILDTPPEEELDDLAQLTSAVCDTPVSIISFIDEKRQWYKAKVGVEITEVHIKKSFCRYTLNNPHDLLIVEDPFADKRFCNNPNVTRKNGIKFYAAAPLVSKDENVIGTVCAIDFISKKISEKQKLALKIISKKVMQYLEIRKKLNDQELELDLSAKRLKKLTDLAPGAIFKFSADDSGNMEFIFLSDGINNLVKKISIDEIKKEPKLIIDIIHPEDKGLFIQSFQESFEKIIPLDIEYRIMASERSIMWHWLKANPEKNDNGVVVWYGTIQNITQKKKHLETLEQMLFDLSHVIRKPTANILGCIDALKKGDGSDKETKEMIALIQNQTNDLESFIRNLNSDYFNLKRALKKKWN